MTETATCPLTAREIEIVGYLAEGDTAKAIAKRTGLSEFSVTMHIKTARRFASAKNSPHLAAIALRKGWIK